MRMPSVPPTAIVPVAKTRRIAVALEFRQRGASEGGRRRDRGAADRAESRAGADHRHRHAAATVADEGARRPEQILRQARALRESAHQDEKRDHRERIVREQKIRRRLHVVEEDGPTRDGDVAGAARRQHRQAHRHAQRDAGRASRQSPTPRERSRSWGHPPALARGREADERQERRHRGAARRWRNESAGRAPSRSCGSPRTSNAPIASRHAMKPAKAA